MGHEKNACLLGDPSLDREIQGYPHCVKMMEYWEVDGVYGLVDENGRYGNVDLNYL